MSPRAARTLAQAKINLALRVLAMEADGYHSIETVFLRLELGDDVELRVTSGKRSLKCFEMRDWPAEGNLAYRAAAFFADETGWPKGFEIEIVKNIPIGGGLGGGSADAAAVLRILNGLAPKPVSEEALLDLARRLGSDVPFLVSDYRDGPGVGARRQTASARSASVAGRAALFPAVRDRHRAGVRPARRNARRLAQQKSRADDRDVRRLGFRGEKRGQRFRAGDETAVAGDRCAACARRTDPDLFYRMSGSGLHRLQGRRGHHASGEPGPDALAHAVPPGTRSLITRTSTSVVPIELLD